MVSNAKRLRYDSENYYTSSEDDTIVDYGASQPDQEDFKYDQRPKKQKQTFVKKRHNGERKSFKEEIVRFQS